MHKTIVILCRNFDPHKKPFNSEYYWHAYQDLLLALKSCGVNAYFATAKAYRGKGLFSVAYTTDHKTTLDQYQAVPNVIADLVYDKGGFAATDVKRMNPAYVHGITSNKAETYKHFSHYQPLSIHCSTQAQFIEAIHAVPGQLAVVKELTGNGGHGIRIAPKEEILAYPASTYPVLVQEFIDTSVGIDHFVDGLHDLRIKIGGGKVWGGTLRQPAQGEFRANVAQGGTERHLFPDEIPADAVAIAMEIDAFFADYPRYYAVDLAHTANGWRLIELNSKPGLSPVHFSDQARYITESLAEYLAHLAQHPAQQ